MTMNRSAADMTMALRRLFVFVAAIATCGYATWQMSRVLSGGIWSWFDTAFLTAFGLSFLWLAFAFWSAAAGVIAYLFAMGQPGLLKPERGTSLRGRTALAAPIYNEDPARVFANLEAIMADLKDLGEVERFDIHILSDTRDPDRWLAEELAWADLVKRTGLGGRIFYRRRVANLGKKAGNVADFCRRWGRDYEYMVVLDADSLMTGATLVELVRHMDVNPEAGLIQAPPALIGRGTLFGRLLQFASAVYGPVFTTGIAFWQGGDATYWGHNAIIRTRAFADSCGLPELPGRKPWGGPIMSHDFVEAALLRRAGWRVFIAPELGGSFEEPPANIIEYVRRDRRWCQGNLQHAKLLFARGLHPLSRFQLVLGIFAYVISPCWLALVVMSVAAAAWEARQDYPYFDSIYALFPSWPVFDWQAAASLLAAVGIMLLLPRIAAIGLILADGRAAARFGGRVRLLLSAPFELVLSTLLAPIMMLHQSRFILEALIGRSSDWVTSARDDGGVTLMDGIRAHWLHLLVGCALGVTAWTIAPGAFWWLMPFLVSLVLAGPIAALTGSQTAGNALRRFGVLLIPEETSPPPIALHAREIAMAQAGVHAPEPALARLARDPLALAVHEALLPVNLPPEGLDPNVVSRARAKLAAGGAGLDRDETCALLLDQETLDGFFGSQLKRDDRRAVAV